MRKFLIFLVYMGVVSAIVLYFLTSGPSANEMLESLSGGRKLPERSFIPNFIANYAGLLFSCAPSLFFILAKLIKSTNEGPLNLWIIRLPGTALLIGAYGLLAPTIAVSVNWVVIEYIKWNLPPNQRGILLDFQFIKQKDINSLIYFFYFFAILFLLSFIWNLIKAIENYNLKSLND